MKPLSLKELVNFLTHANDIDGTQIGPIGGRNSLYRLRKHLGSLHVDFVLRDEVITFEVSTPLHFRYVIEYRWFISDVDLRADNEWFSLTYKGETIFSSRYDEMSFLSFTLEFCVDDFNIEDHILEQVLRHG
jgi:hypothetical protein